MNSMAPLAFSDTGNSSLPVIIFLHGFTGCRADWADVTQLLSRQYRCVAVDLPGHGDSLIANEKLYCMEASATLVIQSLHSRDIEHFHLVGYSMGGRLALYIELMYPSFVDSVVLESASPGIEDAAAREARRIQDAELACRLLDMSPERFIEEWYSRPIFGTMSRFPEKLVQLKQSRRRLFLGGLAASLRQMGTGSQPALFGKIASIASPTLLLTGEHDNTFRDIAGRMQMRNERVETCVLEDCGHNCHWENPRLFAEVISKFLAKQKVSK